MIFSIVVLYEEEQQRHVERGRGEGHQQPGQDREGLSAAEGGGGGERLPRMRWRRVTTGEEEERRCFFKICRSRPSL